MACLWSEIGPALRPGGSPFALRLACSGNRDERNDQQYIRLHLELVNVPSHLCSKIAPIAWLDPSELPTERSPLVPTIPYLAFGRRHVEVDAVAG